MYVEVEVCRMGAKRGRRIRVLVDTGASFSMIPKRILGRLGIEPSETGAFELADGRVVRRGVGPAVIRYGGKAGGTQVIFGEAGDSAVLGVLALEALGLQVDPQTGRLVKARLLLVSARQVPRAGAPS